MSLVHTEHTINYIFFIFSYLYIFKKIWTGKICKNIYGNTVQMLYEDYGKTIHI